MILSLTIQDFVLISRVVMEFNNGFTVFSGETGAGKSIILDALGFIFGDRADSSFIRRGTESSTLVCHMRVNAEAMNLVTQQGIPLHDDTLLIKRVLQKDGANKAFLNDTPVSVGLLKRISECMVEFHGQFDRLLNTSLHLKIVDQFAQTDALKIEFKDSYLLWKSLKAEFEELENNYNQYLKDRDYFKHLYDELLKFSPQKDEEEGLLQEKNLLQQQEKIQHTVEIVAHAISQRSENVDKLRRAHKALLKLSNDVLLFGDVSLLIGEALDKLALAEDKLEDDARALDLNPKRLGEVEERLLELRSLARKHNCAPDNLLEVCEGLSQKLQKIENIDADAQALQKKITLAQNQLMTCGQQLSQVRKTRSKVLESSIMQELPALKLEKGRFRINFEEKSLTNVTVDGFDHVEFLVDLNGTGQFSPLSKTASGGELARLMLALKVVVAKMQTSPVVIFDEIDSGMGGATASAVALRLKGLAKSSQVIAVTHSPQIAALADHHYFVEKKGDPVVSHLSLLHEETRIFEIARMLSGDEVSEEAKRAAQKLIRADDGH